MPRKVSQALPVILTRAIDLGTVQAAADGVVGPRRFVIEAYDGGPMNVDGFDMPVVVDLETLEYPESIPLVVDHDVQAETTIGCTDSIQNDGKTLLIAGPVTAVFEKPLKVIAQHDLGQKWQASIGVRVGELQEVLGGQIVTVNKQSHRGPLFVLRSGELYHTGVLPAGADWTTKVNLAAAAAQLKGSSDMTFEEWLLSMGIDAATLSDDSMAALTLGYDAMMNPAVPAVQPAVPTPVPAPVPAPVPVPVAAAPVPVPTEEEEMPAQNMTAAAVEEHVKALRAAASVEMTRERKLRVLASAHPQILETAIADGWDEMRTENAVLKANAEKRTPDNRHGSRTKDAGPQVLEAAICMTRKLPGHEKQFSDETLQAAHSQFGRRGISLQQLLLMCAAQNGYAVGPGERIGGNLRTILAHAFNRGAELKAAFSSVNLPSILENVANKELLAGYEADESLMLWKEIAQTKPVSDFKTATSYRLLDSMSYEQLGPGGKIKHGSLGEETYSRQADTYAKMFSLTRQDIINDDLGAFDDLRTRLGVGAAQKLSDVFWLAFLDDSTFWTSARGNYITGATTTLLADFVGLELGKTEFDNLASPTDDGSKRIGGKPEILLVPTELGNVAERIHVANNKDNQTVANANIHAGKYRPVIVPWLSDSSFANSSATAWYLLRNPKRYAPMCVSFLDGAEQPTVESADANFDTLGVEFRGFHDFGCDKAEYLSGIKSKGAA